MIRSWSVQLSFFKNAVVLGVFFTNFTAIVYLELFYYFDLWLLLLFLFGLVALLTLFEETDSHLERLCTYRCEMVLNKSVLK